AALALARRIDDRYRAALIHTGLQVAYQRTGDLDASELHLHASIDLLRALDSLSALGTARANLADLYYVRGQYEAAERCAREVAEQAEGLGLLSVQSSALLCLGDVLRDTGRLAEAASAYERGLALAERAQLRYFSIYGLGRLGLTEALRGDA